jgi:hypothetical protein
MKNTTSIILLLFITILLTKVYSQETTFEYILSTPANEVVRDIYESENNSLYITGFISNNNNFRLMKKGIVLKLNEEGMFIDSILVDHTPKALDIIRIIPDLYSQYILSCQSYDTLGNAQNISIVLKKIDNNLNIINESEEYFFPNEYKAIEYITKKGLNDQFIVAGTVDTLHNDFTMFFYEFNNNFDSIKAKFFLNKKKVFCFWVKALNNGNYWILTEVNARYFILDTTLNIINEQDIPDMISGSYGVKWDSDTSFYLTGEWNGGPDDDIGIIKQFHPIDTLNHYFQPWGTNDTLDFPAINSALDFNNKDSIYIGGTTNFRTTYYGTWPSWYFVIQTDSMLNVRWERFYGGDAYYVMQKIIASNDGGCIIAGTRFDYQNATENELDIHILKLNSEGLLVGTDDKSAPEMHEALVFPNPGSNYLRVRIASQYKHSTFELYDMSGKKVLSQQITGRWGEMNTTFLKTGTYVYKIHSNDGLLERGKWVKR